eukprot:4259102-Lingulodinium_polyedra.AAC.1
MRAHPAPVKLEGLLEKLPQRGAGAEAPDHVEHRGLLDGRGKAGPRGAARGCSQSSGSRGHRGRRLM